MKRFTFFFIFCSLFSYAQNVLRVDYDFSRTPREIKGLENISDAMKNQILGQIQKPKKQVLLYSNGNSIYAEQNELTENPSKSFMKQTHYGESTKILKSKDDKGIYSYYKFPNEEFYTYQIPIWKKIEYKSETENIAGFDCKLVEVTDEENRLLKIWYTEILHINAGPSIYYGFPGLVLKVESSNFKIIATNVDNDTEKIEIEKRNPNLKILSEADVEKKMENIENLIGTPQQKIEIKKIHSN
ncbi:MAG: GLPGLI family protein [Bergeyella sp.]